MVAALRSVLALVTVNQSFGVDHTHSKYDDRKLDEFELEALHDKLDGDKDGKLNIDEILAHFKEVRLTVTKSKGHGHLFLYDEDNDKHLSLEEHLPRLANATRVAALGMDVSTAMEDMDENGDGKLSWNEFFHFDSTEVGEVDAQSQARFDSLDVNDDGFVSPAELASETIQQETEKFKAADKNGNGVLDHQEIIGLIHPEMDDAVLSVAVKYDLQEKDTNSDGKLSRQEFFGLDDDEEVSEGDESFVWKHLDTNNDDFIDLSEMRHYTSGEFEARDTLKEALDVSDGDGDGKVTAKEFSMAADSLAGLYAMNIFAHWHDHHEL